ncbi:MAG: NAD(P)H-binding protein [Planctomycetes bacterium]|nr:NAD(P)H-binding protein [Planctomycetota bacterium]
MTSPPRSVLILGAGGRFGGSAVEAFARAGWQVLAHARRTPSAAAPASVRWLNFDLADTAAGEHAAADASVVVHAVNPPYTAWRTQLLPLARHGMDLAQRLGARFMLPGNVYNFGSSMPALLDERTPERADTVKGRLRVQLEAEMAQRADTGLRSTVIRGGDFFGHGDGSWVDLAIVRSLSKGKLIYPGPLDRAHAWAYLPDLARAFVAVAERPAAAPFERLHFAGHTLTGQQMLDAVQAAALATGLATTPLRRGGMPWGLIRAGGVFVPIWREIAEMAYLWQVPHALVGTALQQRVGDLHPTPIAQALQRSLRALFQPRTEGVIGAVPPSGV